MPSVLVTGANRGLGLEFARQYAAADWRVHAACRDPNAAEALAGLGKKPLVIPGWSNRLANVVMERVLPHRVAIRLMGRVMRGMYARP